VSSGKAFVVRGEDWVSCVSGCMKNGKRESKSLP